MHSYEVWIGESGVIMGWGHTPERRRHLTSPTDRLIARIEVSDEESANDKTTEAYFQFMQTGIVLKYAASIFSDSYSNGLVLGDRIELLRDIDDSFTPLPKGTILEVDQGDVDFPEVVYANTKKWPKGRGCSVHYRLVTLRTSGIGEDYRLLGASRKSKDSNNPAHDNP